MFSRILQITLGVTLFMSNSNAETKSSLKIDFEKYTLPNGLDVILHQDHSDPIVSLAVVYHVGSNRETVGKTGFAHLFEHILFQESQHVPQDQFFKKILDAGGTANGFTFSDGTCYYESVPKDAFELIFWLESDRMGYLLSTVTQESLENQQDVVQNEKRQRNDNTPYGNRNYVLGKTLYPENHPYNWQVIGSLEDLQNASLKDVHEFFNKWYGPNNATLVVAGDFQTDEAKKLVEKYFGEIKRQSEVTQPKQNHVRLNETRKVFYQDNFAASPELTLSFPSTEHYTEDSYALEILAELLSEGKNAPLYKKLVEEKKLVPSIWAYQNSSEITGEFRIQTRTFPEANLTEVENAIFEALADFEKNGFTQKDLERIKAKAETKFYNGISSILNKSFKLAFYNTFTGSPDYIEKDLQKTLSVTKQDVMRIFKKYLKGKNFVSVGVVPKGQTELAVKDSKEFFIEEEEILTEVVSEKRESSVDLKIEKIPSKFDRSIEPPKGETPRVKVPEISDVKFKNELAVYLIENNELPLINFSLRLKGGMLFDEKIGTADLLSKLLLEGTKNKTPLELEEAIDNLGASITTKSSEEFIEINVTTLSSKFDEVYSLFEEILIEPRFDAKEFERLKLESIEYLKREKTKPTSVAAKVFPKLVWGSSHLLANSAAGTEASVESIEIEDLRNYYKKFISPNLASISVVGNISIGKVKSSFKSLESKWQNKNVGLLKIEPAKEIKKSKIYFVDIPNAKQSVIQIGKTAFAQNDPIFYPTFVMNYELGGKFSSRINLILREEKGYTYGARTRLYGHLNFGHFFASTSVKSNTTFESVKIIKEQLKDYRNGISENELASNKLSIIKSNALDFETLGDKLTMLKKISFFGLPKDYVKVRENIVQEMTVSKHKELAKNFINPDKMIYLVVGDAETQLEPLKKLGLGEPILLDKDGDKIIQ